MPSYGIIAASCPAIATYPALINPGDNPIPTGILENFIVGDQGPDSRDKMNRDICKIAVLYRHGGGLRAILNGLGLATAASLSLPIGKGQAAFDGLATLGADTTLAMTDDSLNYVWFSDGEQLQRTATTTPPAGVWVYLGAARAAAGQITEIDYSGRLELRGGKGYRKTGDVGMPTDTPPSGMMFINETLGGTYEWDGSKYVRYWEPLGMQQETITDKVKIPSGYQVLMFNRLTVTGFLQVDGNLKVEGW